MSDSYCDPNWHDGEKVPADFMLKVDGKFVARFACCKLHIGDAIHYLKPISPDGWVQIRRER